MNFSQALPRSQWAQAARSPDIDVIEQMIFHYSLLPRLAISLLVGAGPGWWACCFSKCCVTRWRNRRRWVLQQARNWGLPSPRSGRSGCYGEPVCCAGRGLCCWLNRLWRRVGKRLSPVTLILAGLVVSLYCGAINQLLVIFHHDQLQSMFLWSTGTLTQTDWGGVERLWPQLLGGVMLTLLLLRPLTLMGLDDGVARNLGLALSLARLAALSLAIVISALLVNAVGIIGFIGLFAPLLAKMLGRGVCCHG